MSQSVHKCCANILKKPLFGDVIGRNIITSPHFNKGVIDNMFSYDILLDTLVLFMTTYGRDLIKRHICPNNSLLGDIIVDTIVSAICVVFLILKLFI